jgi:hypothetical protein
MIWEIIMSKFLLLFGIILNSMLICLLFSPIVSISYKIIVILMVFLLSFVMSLFFNDANTDSTLNLY